LSWISLNDSGTGSNSKLLYQEMLILRSRKK